MSIDDKLKEKEYALEKCFSCSGYDHTCKPNDSGVMYQGINGTKESPKQFLCFFKDITQVAYSGIKELYIEHCDDMNRYVSQDKLNGSD